MRIVGIIPARMGSSRFPGKPLANILGHPMIEHVYRRSLLSPALDAVYVATCDKEVARATEKFGAKTVRTSDKHQRASDRVAEAADQIEADIVVMIQGDEPMVVPEMISLALEPLVSDPKVVCTNLISSIRSEEELEDWNTVKVVMNRASEALYFSRRPIPWQGSNSPHFLRVYKQVCVIPFRRDFLADFAALEPTPLERAESIDMLRALEHGYPIRLVLCSRFTHAVDTPEDLKLVEQLMQHDPLIQSYDFAGRIG